MPCAIIIAANLLAISKSVSHKMYHEKKNYVTKYFKLFKILSTLKVPSAYKMKILVLSKSILRYCLSR